EQAPTLPQNISANTSASSRMFCRMLFFLRLPLLFRPTLFHCLACAPQGQGIGGNIVGDAGRRADVCSLANCDGSDERGIASYKYAVFNRRLVFMHAVVVAENRPRANIH